MANLHISGISPVIIDLRHIIARGNDNEERQRLSNIAGNASGPAEAVDFNSPIAVSKSSSVKIMSVSVFSGRTLLEMSAAGNGVLKTELYCSLRISAS